MANMKLAKGCELLILLLATQLVLPTAAFLATPYNTLSASHRQQQIAIFADAEDSSSSTKEGSFDPKDIFAVADYEEFSLLPHRPLGMTIEESLADSRFVLVTKVVEGGHADQAGIEVGDLLVGISGLFGDLTNVIGLEVETIKGYVGARPDDEPLEIKVARGTDAYDLHEQAVIELCSNESTDKEIEQCVVDYLSIDYDNLNNKPASKEAEEEECDVDDADCLVDNLLDMWSEDLPPPPPASSEKLPSEQKPTETVKPWSSRSSPSGTFVRDPTTGEMKNIG